MPEISAIVVSHRSSGEASACVAALRRAFEHGGIDGEIVLVDCGSGAAEVARLRESGADRVRAIDNRGYSGGVNAGISESRGRLLLFCNADTELDREALRPLIEAAESPRVGAAAPVQFADRRERIFLPTGYGSGFFRDLASSFRTGADARFARHARRQWRLWTGGGETDYLVGSVLLTRRDVVDRVGRFDESFPFEYEETEWEDRLRAAGWSLRVVAEARALHFPGTSSRRNPETDERRARSRRRYRTRRYGRIGAAVLEGAGSRLRGRGPECPAVETVPREEGSALAFSPNPSLLPFAGVSLASDVDAREIGRTLGGAMYVRAFRTADGSPGPLRRAGA
jgi:GT2 family glycosyltransferase